MVSFGLAGGLDPALRPGALLVPGKVIGEGGPWDADPALAERFGGLTGHVILAGRAIVATAAEKRRLFADTQADAVDLESGAVALVAAAHRVPFAVVRAICDPAQRDLPPAALVALDSNGAIGLLSVIGSVLRRPGQLPGLLTLAEDAAKARRSLLRLVTLMDALPPRG